MNNNELQELWNKNFIIFLICSIKSSFGASLSAVALSFLVLKLTGSANQMSVVLALWFLPTIFTPISATIVDRMNLKLSLVISVLMRAMLLVSLYATIKIVKVSIEYLYLFAVLNGLVWTVLVPASTSVIPCVIPKNQLTRGNSLLAIGNQSMQIIGLVAGGAIVTLIGPELTLLFEGVCYFIVAGMLMFITVPKNYITNNSFYVDFILGGKIITTSYVIILIMIASFMLNAFIAPMQVLMPIYILKIGKGAFEYSIFMASMSAGMLITNIFIAIINEKFRKSHFMIYGWLSAGISLMGLAIVSFNIIFLFYAFLFGVSLSILNTGTIILLQTNLPSEFRARVLGTLGSVAQVGTPFSLLMLTYWLNFVSYNDFFYVAAVLAFTLSIIWTFIICKLARSSHNLDNIIMHVN